MTNSKMIPVKFANKDGHQLFGVLHEPREDKFRDAAIIILSPGVKSRVAPHRLYLKMAERFSELGFLVLRFDFYGLGDSEGEIDEYYLADLYCSIQVGRYIEDTLSAVELMDAQYGKNKIILSGLCGGAITGLHAGVKDKRIVALHGLGIPVILDSSNMDKYKFITIGQLSDLKNSYLKKMFDIKSWLRLLTLKSDFRLIFKSVFNNGKNINKKEKKENNNLNDNFNPFFPKIFHAFAKEKKINLIFSESDRLYWEFEEKYLNRYNSEFEKIEQNLNIDIIKEANHIFSFSEWYSEMMEKSKLWLTQLNTI